MAIMTNNPETFHSGIDGQSPAYWFGASALDGTIGAWYAAPVGSEYIYKTASLHRLYRKMTNNGRTDDWVQMGGCLQQRILYSQFTDGGGASGTLVLTDTIPAGAWVQQTILQNVTGFTGNTSAVITVGDGSDVDRYNTGTPSVFTTATAIDPGVPSGTKIHTAAATVTVTVTGGSDFTAISAGALTIRIFYLF